MKQEDDLSGFTFAGMPLVEVVFIWEQGIDGIGDFLDDQSMPSALPPTVAGRLVLTFLEAPDVEHRAFFRVDVVPGLPVSTPKLNFEGVPLKRNRCHSHHSPHGRDRSQDHSAAELQGNLAAHAATHRRHESAPGGCGSNDDQVVAWPRFRQHHSPICRGQLRNEAPRSRELQNSRSRTRSLRSPSCSLLTVSRD